VESLVAARVGRQEAFLAGQQIPGTGSVFEVRVSGETVWSRKAEGRFPEIKELKQRVRDRVAPDKDLGHSDRTFSSQPDET